MCIFLCSIEELNFPFKNYLEGNGIRMVLDLVCMDKGQLGSKFYFGRKALLQIESALSDHGLYLGMSFQEIVGHEGVDADTARRIEQLQVLSGILDGMTTHSESGIFGEEHGKFEEQDAWRQSRLVFAPGCFFISVGDPVYNLPDIVTCARVCDGFVRRGRMDGAIVFPQGEYWIRYEPGLSGIGDSSFIIPSLAFSQRPIPLRNEDLKVNIGPRYRKDPLGFLGDIGARVIHYNIRS